MAIFLGVSSFVGRLARRPRYLVTGPGIGYHLRRDSASADSGL
jgi:hypothetical protein